MKKNILILIYTVLLFSVLEAPANEPLLSRYGLYGHFMINMHNPDFNKLPDVPNCCPNFDAGSGTGFALGVLYEQPIAVKLLGGIRVGYSLLNGELAKTEPTMMFANGQIINGEFEHTIDASISNIGLDAYLSYALMKRLFVSGGLRLGFSMSGDFDQVETITNPEHGATFIDDNGNDTRSRTRNEYSGEIPGAAGSHLFAFAGLSYELPLNKDGTLLLAPEALFYYGLSDLADDVDWTVNTLNIGLSLKYSLRETAQGIPGLSADVKAFGVDLNGKEDEIVKITVEEFSTLRFHPLLTYIFFDKKSSALPDRYITMNESQAEEFEENDLYSEQTIDIYHNVLNIIGKRMTENPKENITLVGCNDNDGSEKSDIALSQARAETIRDYLTEVWKINPSRIKVESRNLPEKASNIKEEDGLEENRRVEIRSDSWEIMKPVFCNDTIRKTNPGIVRFYPEVQADDDIEVWYVSADQDSRNLKRFTGNDIPDDHLDWDLSDNLPVHSDRLSYFISAKDNYGQTTNSEIKTIPVEVITIQKKRAEGTGDKEEQKFSLILFDFNKANLNKLNNRIIKLIRERISPESTVTITGHTDRIGDEQMNLDLSERRAASAHKALARKSAIVSGRGEADLLFDNELPEGRFYCRTVNVIVETKVE